uniref:WW/Rsp5/WWP n=1 Tax=Medicago truncatula TaxID=3880 RepID=A2Q4M0_MEDTR|nr:WW/Rsp5/WWP [Medicago truncatula]
MEARQVLGTGKYLGVLSMVGRSKSSTFKFIKDRMWSKINSWSSRCLSQAGREILIKSVLQSIPSYLMSTFMLPNSLINEIEKMLNAFWWGHGNGSNRGMCFKSLKAFNMAMLGKQAWKILTHPKSMITRLFKARYFPTSDYFAARSGHNPSYVWRSIWSVKSVLQNGFRWSIGTGTNILVWDPFWIQNGYSIPPPLEMNHAMANLKVADLLQLHTNNGTRRTLAFCLTKIQCAFLLVYVCSFFFLTKINDIHSFKLIEYIDIIQI